MERPFASPEEYLGQVLELCALRLSLAEGGTEDPTWKAQHLERTLRRRSEATLDAGEVVPLEYLFRAYRLTDFERHCVYLALAPELDRSFEGRYAACQTDRTRLPELELCLRTFAPQRDRQLALLSQWHSRSQLLVELFAHGCEMAEGRGDLTVGLKLHRRIVDFVLDFFSEEPALIGAGELFWPGEELPELVLHRDKLERMLAFGEEGEPGTRRLFYLQGEEMSGRRTLARHFCELQKRPLVTVDLENLLRREGTWDEILRPILREVRIRRAGLALTHFERLQDMGTEPPTAGEDRPPVPEPKQDGGKVHIRRLLELSARATDLVFLLSPLPWQPQTPCAPWTRAVLELGAPDTGERLTLWEHALSGAALEEGVSLESLANKFALYPGQIAAAAREAARLRDWAGEETIGDDILHRACRAQLSHTLGKLASRVNARYTWEDLILPPEQKRRLREACDQVEFRRRVYDQWGFGKKVAYGRGVSMLFSGPPGTGKTMAAQVIANRLKLELYKVDLSGVISKYVGETEKQLSAVFEEVKKSQSILFFDEADALFGKRAETKDSHDRYANVQTSFLLQKMEEYDGIVILTSNFLQNFDEAFKRRLKFIIDFTLPDRERREQIWRSVLPRELPRDEDLDFDFLARSFEFSGSSIKNVAVAGAFLAAAEGRPLSMVHLLRAVQAEQHKAGKSVGREELGEYYHQVQRDLEERMRQE